jgi:hypothetical protein
MEVAMHRFSIYSPLRQWKKGDMLVSPFLCLRVGTHSKENDNILLSPQLMSDPEIDEIVAQLKVELDEFGKKAKRELKSLREKMVEK